MGPRCWCGERGYPTAHSWYLCEWGHEFYKELDLPPGRLAIPFHIDPTVVASSMPYGNFIETGTSRSLPRYLRDAALEGVK